LRASRCTTCPGLARARRGEHYIDASALIGDTYRIVQKHTNGTLQRPPGWEHADPLSNDRRLTNADVARMIEFETAEQEQLRELAQVQAEALKADTAHACAEHAEALDPSIHLWMEKQAKAHAEAATGFAAFRKEARRKEEELASKLADYKSAVERLEARSTALTRELAARDVQLSALTKEHACAAATEHSLLEKVARLEAQLARRPRSRGAPVGGWRYPVNEYTHREYAQERRS
jgi:hypothetical protein